MIALVVLAAIATAAPPNADSSFFPLRLNESNTLLTYDGSIRMAFVVETARAFSDASIGKVRFENPWFTYSWLVYENAAGTWLAGYSIGGTDQYFARPTPLFMKGGTAGKVWTGEATTVTLMATGLTVNATVGEIKGASRFRITYSDGSMQDWTVAPGRGIVGVGPNSADATQSEWKKGTAPSSYSAAATAGQCTLGGLSAIPTDPALTLEQRQGAIKPASDIGAKFNVSTISWSELEPSPKVYSTKRMVDEFSAAASNGMEVALTVRTIDTGFAHRPSDLKGLAWDHPTVVSRYVAAVKAILAKVSKQPKWIHVGYEVEPYLLGYPAELAPFKRFVTSVAAELKKTSAASVGIVFGFDSTKGHNEIFRQLESVCAHVAFDYYALRPMSGYMHVGADSPTFDLPLMQYFAGDKKVLLTEVGYASSLEVNGGLDKQADYYTTLLDLVGKSKGQIAAVNVWSLNDMPLDIVTQTTQSYGLNVPGATAFLSSLGIRDSRGVPKPAYSPVLAAFGQFNLTTTCR